jgi:prepilin-type N-terminal cleavage/methylation domain-containing protein
LKSAPPARGFTLVEALIVIALIAIVAVTAVGVLGSQAPTKVDAAAVEVANVLRFAVSEANRTGGYLFVDASVQGRLRVFKSNASGAMLSAATDPLTKGVLQIDASASPWSGGITITPKFLQGGTPYKQLLVGPGPQFQAFDAGINRGALQSGSGVTLTAGLASATVVIEGSGRISAP